MITSLREQFVCFIWCYDHLIVGSGSCLFCLASWSPRWGSGSCLFRLALWSPRSEERKLFVLSDILINSLWGAEAVFFFCLALWSPRCGERKLFVLFGVVIPSLWGAEAVCFVWRYDDLVVGSRSLFCLALWSSRWRERKLFVLSSVVITSLWEAKAVCFVWHCDHLVGGERKLFCLAMWSPRWQERIFFFFFFFFLCLALWSRCCGERKLFVLSVVVIITLRGSEAVCFVWRCDHLVEGTGSCFFLALWIPRWGSGSCLFCLALWSPLCW